MHACMHACMDGYIAPLVEQGRVGIANFALHDQLADEHVVLKCYCSADRKLAPWNRSVGWGRSRWVEPNVKVLLRGLVHLGRGRVEARQKREVRREFFILEIPLRRAAH